MNAMDPCINDQTRTTIRVMSNLSDADLETAALELEVDYEVFCMDYRGPALSDPYEGFAEMLRAWDIPWNAMDGSGLNGLTEAQFYFAWAWSLTESVERMLDDVVDHRLPVEAARTAVMYGGSLEKSLGYAKLLLATGRDRVAQQSLERVAQNGRWQWS